MLGRGVTITSTDPDSGAPLRVTVCNGHTAWQPDTAVVFIGSATAAGPPGGRVPAADSPPAVHPAVHRPVLRDDELLHRLATAQAWIARHPDVTGVVLTQPQAVRLGVDIFGRLLDEWTAAQPWGDDRHRPATAHRR
jgi:Alkylmercury lyase